MWLTFSAMIAIEFKLRSPALAFVGGALVVAGIPCTVYLLYAGPFPDNVVHLSVSYIILFNIIFAATRLFFHPPQRVLALSVPAYPLSNGERRFLLAVAAVFALALIIKLASAGFSISVLMGRTWREGGRWEILVTYSAHISFGICLALMLLRRRFWLAVAIAAIVWLVVVDRSRALAMAGVVPIILILLFRPLKGRGRVLKVIAGVSVLGMAVVGFYVVQQIRYLGVLSAMWELPFSVILSSAVDRLLSMQGDLAISRGMISLIHDSSSIPGEGTFVTLQRMLTFWMPSSFKPQDITISIAQSRGMGPGGSYHPVIYGLSWTDGNWLGLTYAVLLAAIFGVLDRIIIRLRQRTLAAWAILVGPYAVFATLAARGSLSNGWVVLVVCTTVLLIIARFTLPAIPRHRNPVYGAYPSDLSEIASHEAHS